MRSGDAGLSTQLFDPAKGSLIELRQHLSSTTEPFVVRDASSAPTAAIKLDQAFFRGSELCFVGWRLGHARIEILCNGEVVKSDLAELSRDDVMEAFPIESAFKPGFVITIDEPPVGEFTLRWHILGIGASNAVEFALDNNWDQQVDESANAGAHPVEFAIDCAISVPGRMILTGWLGDHHSLRGRAVYVRAGGGKVRMFPFVKTDANGLARVFRPDVSRALGAGDDRYPLGFVVCLDFDADMHREVSIAFDASMSAAKNVTVTSIDGDLSAVQSVWGGSGFALQTLAATLDDRLLLDMIDDVDVMAMGNYALESLVAIDRALVINGSNVLLFGRLMNDDVELSSLEIVTRKGPCDLMGNLRRASLPAHIRAQALRARDGFAFVTLVDGVMPPSHGMLRIRAAARDGRRQVFEVPTVVADWSTILGEINTHQYLADEAVSQISESRGLRVLPNFQERVASLRRMSFVTRQSAMSDHVDDRTTTIAAVDRVYALGDAGLLVFGWHHEPESPIESVSVHGPSGAVVDVTDALFPLPRQDVSDSLKSRFVNVAEMCGFLCHVRLPTQPGELRAMRLTFGGKRDVWLKLEQTRTEAHGVELIKEVLSSIPAPFKIRDRLFTLFDKGLGDAIEAMRPKRQVEETQIQQRQFGAAPASPGVSVIVPLYGRFDFMRHQLAHFADDSDFDDADLIYVVDDPSIVTPTLDTATAYSGLIRKPFRVVWYGRNLGFAGANNVGVRVARADKLLLLNSDVIPRARGWLSTLSTALDQLPEAGAVGPLLQFADDSVQHAGMAPKRDAYLPGFLLNTHPGKGQSWGGNESPSQHPLLTAACFMLRTADYRRLGGLDEGYVIGDFEDSDLCLKLVKLGRKLWLVPKVKLWHLERQSQNLEQIAGHRQLITLFNGWRYQKRIEAGVIADPETAKY